MKLIVIITIANMGRLARQLRCVSIFALSTLILVSLAAARAQTPDSARLRGVVMVLPAGTAARNAIITVGELKRSALTNEAGQYELDNVPPGRYQLIAHLDRVPEVIKMIDVKAGETATADFELSLSAVSEQVTVTASGSSEAVTSAYHSVNSVGSIELTQKNTASIGEALDGQLGVAKRSFGPGSGRPVIRGFDGDRVLVLQDGLRLGGIASQSADEVEPIDVLSLDRVEIVKGPATLLYGSNAIGGVVNGISTNEIYQRGLSGYATSFGGTNNWQAGAGAGFKYGTKSVLVFGNGGVQKANDYHTPLGTVLNSYARGSNVSGGFGWFPRKGWLSFGYSYDRRRHGIPVEPDEVDFEYLKERRHSFEVKGGLREINSFVESGDFAFRYNDYRVREFEFESDENLTELDSIATNKNFNYRAALNQKRRGKLSGSFGVSGFTRDFLSVGEEAPAPHTRQHSVAAFALERFDLERIGFQFGGRIEQNAYNPEGNFRDRNFVGFSGSAGVRVALWTGGSFVAHYQHSFRAPALEELYNHGPHPGILTFDIGNQNLNAEQGDGIDLLLRHNTKRVRMEASAYYYNIRNFVFTAFTGQNDPASNLPIIRYEQETSRFAGNEASIEAKLVGDLWVNGKLDYVRADLVDLNKNLPRIPPLRGAFGFEWRHKGFILRPELVMANQQNRIFDHETPTAGYAVFNVNASYSFVTNRVAHVISINGYNLGDTLYYNHLSFIKRIAPEIGRNVRLSYSLRF
jgi:iron complex outermembrane receptor protein